MGGNGTFAAGKIAKYRWRTIGKVNGVKILAPINGALKLPEEAHKSRMYILQTKSGVFRQLRVYDSEHKVRFEIGYHPERRIDKSGKDVLHYHIITHSGFNHGPAHRVTPAMIRRFGKFMKGVLIDEKR